MKIKAIIAYVCIFLEINIVMLTNIKCPEVL